MWKSRIEDVTRHLNDLQARTYEGAASRTEREEVFIEAFRLTTPVALRVLEDLRSYLLDGRGTIEITEPASDGAGGIEGAWVLSWPEQQQARHRLNGDQIEPIRLVAGLPIDFLHGHLIAPMPGLPDRVVAWPLQVTSARDAERQEPVLRILAEAILHERIYQAGGNWGLFGRADHPHPAPSATSRRSGTE
jgi:hypothetical protein